MSLVGSLCNDGNCRFCFSQCQVRSQTDSSQYSSSVLSRSVGVRNTRTHGHTDSGRWDTRGRTGVGFTVQSVSPLLREAHIIVSPPHSPTQLSAKLSTAVLKLRHGYITISPISNHGFSFQPEHFSHCYHIFCQSSLWHLASIYLFLSVLFVFTCLTC